MQSITEQFKAWVRTKPADERYDFTEAGKCAFYQFAVAYGLPNPERLSHDLPSQLLSPLAYGDDEDWTFGALAKRLEKVQP